MESDIQNFFKRQVILITGGTGYIGKQLLEKLLRSCSELKKIYLIVRPKKNKSASQRFKEIFEYPCFDLLKNLRPDFYKQVELIEGDCAKENFGIDDKYLDILREEVTICINSVANVNFIEPLRNAYKSNVFSAMNITKLASEIKNLKMFAHISTAYSHCYRKEMDEIFYKSPINPFDLQKLLDSFDDTFIDAITPHLLGVWPNTYTYTKALAEEVILTASSKIPCVMVRPSIVTPTFEEPMPGWIDNLYGAAGVIVGVSLGVIKSLHLNRTNITNCVPCDFVANSILAAIWENAKSSEKIKASSQIYNYTGSDINRFTWAMIEDSFYEFFWKYATTKMISYPNYSSTPYATIHKIRVFIWHTTMAHIADFIRKLFGLKPIAVKKIQFINKMLDVLTYFQVNDIKFLRRNLHSLYDKMNETDKKLFNFDIDHMDVKKYIEVSVSGGRLYLLKDTLDTVPIARLKFILFGLIHYLFLGLLTYLLYKFLRIIF